MPVDIIEGIFKWFLSDFGINPHTDLEDETAILKLRRRHSRRVISTMA